MDEMNNKDTSYKQKNFERIVFVSRLTAIGDVIIASQAISKLIKNEYFPIFITSHTTKDIALKIIGLNAFICYEKNKDTHYYLNNLKVDEAIFIREITNINTSKKNIFIDLQKTSRSKRSYHFITNTIKFPIEKKYSVSKRIFYRIFLVVLSWLSFKQKKIIKKINIKRIHDIQESLIKKIVQNDKREFIKLESTDQITLIKGNNNFLKNINYISLFPGASGFIKSWPKEKFKEIIQQILKETDLSIAICGSQNEEYIGEYLNFPPNERVFNLINQTSLEETIDIIANSKYVVTNDSFAAHAADTFKIPASVIFGATSPQFGFTPIYPKISIEYENLSCSPCSRHGKGTCRYKNLKCLQDIDCKKIFEKINQLEH